MGSIVGSLSSGLLACCGSCAASCCCKVLTMGSTPGKKGAGCVLLWMQAIGLLLALGLSASSEWLSWPCSRLKPMFGVVGICEAGKSTSPDQAKSSWEWAQLALDTMPDNSKHWAWSPELGLVKPQIIYRAEAMTFLCFMFLLILCASGCSRQAGSSCPAGKIAMVPVLFLVSLFLPNSIFSFFGQFAGLMSALFLVCQGLVVIDAAYTWNDDWFRKVTDAKCRGDLIVAKKWLVANLLAALCLFLVAVGLDVKVFLSYTTSVTHPVLITTIVTSLLLTFLSITEWCEHGSLLTACAVCAMLQWLAWEAIAGLIDPKVPPVIGVSACCLALTFQVCFAATTKKDAEELPIAADDASKEIQERFDKSAFTKICATNAAACLYIASEVEPAQGFMTFTTRLLTLVAVAAMYGWSLVAPKVFSNRQFG